MHMRTHLPAVAAITILLCLPGAMGEVTGFRGDGAGHYPAATPPTAWSPTSNVVWKTALTNWSNASPVLSGKRLFVCAEPATLICVSADSGAIQWMDSLADLPAPPPPAHPVNGYTSPTPCTDGKQVWMVTGHGLVACWGVGGKRQWVRAVEKPPNGWGGCISPRLAGGTLVVQFNNLFGLDPLTGVEKWKLATPWGWGTPVVASIAGRDVLYTCKGAIVDPVSGREMGKGLVNLSYNSPCLTGNTVYYIQDRPQAYTLPATPDGAPSPLWSNAGIAKDRYYATPLVVDGLVYAVNQVGNLSVLDQKTGALVYQKRIDHLKGTVYPSPTLAGNYIFLSSENGHTVVIAPGTEYREVARNTLEPFRSCPVFAGRRMFIRGQQHLWCIGR